MKKKNRILRLLKLIYIKLFRINDTPQKIAQGFGLGVFLGILPGTGPIAAAVSGFSFPGKPDKRPVREPAHQYMVKHLNFSLVNQAGFSYNESKLAGYI